MTTIIGQGNFKYRVAEGWGKLPAGWKFGDVAAVGIDSKDRVYAFNRGEHPMVVFDRDGNFLGVSALLYGWISSPSLRPIDSRNSILSMSRSSANSSMTAGFL